MKEQDINNTIAEIVGWSNIKNYNTISVFGSWKGYPPFNAIVGNPLPIPSYSEDLNAMNDAERILTDNQQNYYAWLLVQSVDNHKTWKPEEFPTLYVWEMSLTEVWFAANAGAKQRAEAFLRVLNKWKD